MYIPSDEQMQVHPPDFLIPLRGRSFQETRLDILHRLAPSTRDEFPCQACRIWTLNVESCIFLEPLFVSDDCVRHVHFNYLGRLTDR